MNHIPKVKLKLKMESERSMSITGSHSTTHLLDDQPGSVDQSSDIDSSIREEKGVDAGADCLIPGTPVPSVTDQAIQFPDQPILHPSTIPLNLAIQSDLQDDTSFNQEQQVIQQQPDAEVSIDPVEEDGSNQVPGASPNETLPEQCPAQIDNETNIQEQVTEIEESGFAVQQKDEWTWKPVKKLRRVCRKKFGFDVLIETSPVWLNNMHAYQAKVWLPEISELKHEPIAVHVASSKKSAKREAARDALALLNADSYLVERYIQAFQTRTVLFIAPAPSATPCESSTCQICLNAQIGKMT